MVTAASGGAIPAAPAIYVGALGALSRSAGIASFDRANAWRSARGAEVPVPLPPLLRSCVLQL